MAATDTSPSPVTAGGTAISPVPTDDEAAAIVAAVEALWPRPVIETEESARRAGPWRFSGRWWSRPVAARRDRPWY